MASPQEMDDYVRRRDYGQSSSSSSSSSAAGGGVPKIALGLVFEGNDPVHFRYRLRPNSTNINKGEYDYTFTDEYAYGNIFSSMPSTKHKWKPSIKRDSESCAENYAYSVGNRASSCTALYMYNGVLTLQRLVGDYWLDRTGAASQGIRVSENGVAFCPFPTPGYFTTDPNAADDEGFFALLGST